MDTRIKIVSQINQGLSAARNTGLRNATGNFIIFVDSDDTITENFIESLLFASKKFNSEVVMTATTFCSSSNTHTEKLHCGIYNSFTDKVNSLPHGGCWNKIYEKDFLDKYNLDFPQGLLYEDNPFTLKVLYYCSSLVVIDKGSYNYFSNPNSICTDPTKENRRKKDSLIILKQVWDFFSSKLSRREKQILLKFCSDKFISPVFFEEKTYYKELQNIVGNKYFFKRKRFRIIKRSLRKQLRNYILNLFKKLMRC